LGVNFGYAFPSLRGIQAGREYFVAMCPMRLIPKIFTFDQEDLPPEYRAQRILNKGRIPALAKYVLKNRKDYVFSAITASINSKIRFESISKTDDEAGKMGTLYVPLDAKFIINDGQHRRAAIEMALKERPELGDETLAVVFFLDIGLKRCQQMFADLNRFAIRPSKSIGVLYDQRDQIATVAKIVALKSETFKGLVELERSTLSLRSRKLFTLSAIYNATESLIDGLDWDVDSLTREALSFWEETAKHFPEWEKVRRDEMAAGEVRKDYIHSHGIVLQSIGRVGNTLLRHQKGQWKKLLGKLEDIDWRRSNTRLWEGRALIGGKVSKAAANVALTSATIRKAMGLALSPEEKMMESSIKDGRRG
jgi:DNA sulfur modification protein DndB